MFFASPRPPGREETLPRPHNGFLRNRPYERHKEIIQDQRGPEPVQCQCGLPAAFPLHDGESLHHRQPALRGSPLSVRQHLDSLLHRQPPPPLQRPYARPDPPDHVDSALGFSLRGTGPGIPFPRSHLCPGGQLRVVFRAAHRSPQHSHLEGERCAQPSRPPATRL